jgi:hypothetical protein
VHETWRYVPPCPFGRPARAYREDGWPAGGRSRAGQGV